MLGSQIRHSQKSITYQNGSKLNNPEHNKPVLFMKPTVVKGNQENVAMDANAMAQIEAARAEQQRQEKQEKIEKLDSFVRMNASKLTEERSRRLNQTRKIKEQTVVRQNNVKAKYTVTNAKQKKQMTEQPKKIDTQPMKIQWKKANRVSVEEPEMPRNLEVKPVAEDQSFSSEAPLKKHEPKSKVSIPGPPPSDDEQEKSELDSDLEEGQQSVKDVMGRFEKLRAILKKR